MIRLRWGHREGMGRLIAEHDGGIVDSPGEVTKGELRARCDCDPLCEHLEFLVLLKRYRG